MPFRRKASSTTAATFPDHIHRTMEENEAFLKKKADAPLIESIELVNDAIDYAGVLGQKENPTKLATERVFYFYEYHTLLPTSYSIAINLLVGNIPSCFRDLRLLLEFLAKAYLADARYSDKEFFADRLSALTEEKVNERQRRKREIDLIAEFDHAIVLGGTAITQWRKFSNEIHARGYAQRVLENIVEKNNVPGYALVFPMAYTESGVPELVELGEDIRQFASILKTAFNRYQGQIR